jgi:RHS repeat-associated protein
VHRVSVPSVHVAAELDLAIAYAPDQPELGEPDGVPLWYWDPSAWRRKFWKWAEYRVQQAKQERGAATQIANLNPIEIRSDADPFARCKSLFERGELFCHPNKRISTNENAKASDGPSLPHRRAALKAHDVLSPRFEREHRFGGDRAAGPAYDVNSRCSELKARGEEARRGGSNNSVYISGGQELRGAQFDIGYGDNPSDADYQIDSTTEIAYLFAHGVRLARVAYDNLGGMPTFTSVSEPQQHVLINLDDMLGSTAIVIDRATGELVEATAYLAHGATESDYRPTRWEGLREDYRFTGKEEDVEVGLQYFGKRFLSPYLNRWVSADPLALHNSGQGDFNLFAYVHGAILRDIDPLGLTDPNSAGTDTQGNIPDESNQTQPPPAVETYRGTAGTDTQSNAGGPDNFYNQTDFSTPLLAVGTYAAATSGLGLMCLVGSGSTGASDSGRKDLAISSDQAKAGVAAANAAIGVAAVGTSLRLGGRAAPSPASEAPPEPTPTSTGQALTPRSLDEIAQKFESEASATETAQPIGGEITGYTSHGLNQSISRNAGRGVNAEAMRDAVRDPNKVITGKSGATKFTGEKASVVLNSKGKVVTATGKARGPQLWQEGTNRPSGSGPAQRKANELGYSYWPGAVR